MLSKQSRAALRRKQLLALTKQTHAVFDVTIGHSYVGTFGVVWVQIRTTVVANI